MHYKMTRIVAVPIAAGTVMAMSFLPVQAAQAVPAVARVPCSTQALIAAMTRLSSGEQLDLAARCDYLLTQGLPAVTQDLTIEGNDATLERGYAPGTPSFTILESGNNSLTISGLNFRNGDGAIMIGAAGALTVTGGTFTGNTATDGGAIDDPLAGVNAPTVTGATFVDNRATELGGALFDGNGGANGFYVTHCTFVGNKARLSGGAIFDVAGGNGSISDSVFRGNSSSDGDGGAAYLSDFAGASVSHVVVDDNTAVAAGGILNNGDLAIDNSTFSGNRARAMGGALTDGGFDDQETVTSTRFTGNSASDGGAITSFLLGLGMTLTHVVISGNHAMRYGGGVYNFGILNAIHTLIARNTAGIGGGGIYGDPSQQGVSQKAGTTMLTSSLVEGNKPDNCEPLGSTSGCTG